MISFFEDILNQSKTNQVTYRGNGVTLIALGVTLIARTWSNFDRSIKVTPSVNKVNIVIVNKNKLSFLSDKKHLGECVNKKKYFYVYIFNMSNFDCNFQVTLVATTG